MDDWKNIAQTGLQQMNEARRSSDAAKLEAEERWTQWGSIYFAIERNLAGYFKARKATGHKLQVSSVRANLQFYGSDVVKFIVCIYTMEGTPNFKAYLIIRMDLHRFSECRFIYKFRKDKKYLLFFESRYDIKYFDEAFDETKTIKIETWGYHNVDLLTEEIIKLIERYESSYS